MAIKKLLEIGKLPLRVLLQLEQKSGLRKKIKDQWKRRLNFG
jgi:hypothetical protein